MFDRDIAPNNSAKDEMDDPSFKVVLLWVYRHLADTSRDVCCILDNALEFVSEIQAELGNKGRPDSADILVQYLVDQYAAHNNFSQSHANAYLSMAYIDNYFGYRRLRCTENSRELLGLIEDARMHCESCLDYCRESGSALNVCALHKYGSNMISVRDDLVSFEHRMRAKFRATLRQLRNMDLIPEVIEDRREL